MLDAAADGFERGGDHVAAIGDCRRAEHDHKLGAGLKHLVDGARDRLAVMRRAAFGDDRRTGGREAFGSDFQRLLDPLAGQPRQHGRHHADFAEPIGGDSQKLFGHAGERGIARPRVTAKGMIFTVAIISPATTGL